MTQDSRFDNSDARAAWNAAAEAWDEAIESGADYYRHELHGPALLAACEPVADLDVLDLGCGQGYFSRKLAQRGARVVAIDLAERQIASAQRHQEDEPMGIEYHVMGASEVSSRWPDRPFDLVTACMAIQDMADPAAALSSAYSALRPGGRMVFSIPHPCTDTPVREWVRDQAGNKTALTINRYFESGPTVCHWRMRRLSSHFDTPYWRHTLTEWSELIADAGFLIRRLLEPRPTAPQVQRNPELADCYWLPGFLILDLVKLEEYPMIRDATAELP